MVEVSLLLTVLTGGASVYLYHENRVRKTLITRIMVAAARGEAITVEKIIEWGREIREKGVSEVARTLRAEPEYAEVVEAAKKLRAALM